MTTSAWPTLSPDDGPPNVRWETVKTEEEEYLDKLQSKLSRVMSEGYKRSQKSDDHCATGADPDDNVASDGPPDNDEGLHLLYLASGAASQLPPGTPSDDGRFVQGDLAESPMGRSRTVRFRSRVRITSGIHGLSTSSSSTASSSISVPLRGSGTYDTSKFLSVPPAPTASLSEMLPTVATNAWLNEIAAAGRKRRRTSSRASDERSPLIIARPRSYTEPDADDVFDRLQRAGRKTEAQVMFGKWPWRLFNWHWWWWKLEPLVCCFDDDSDMG